MARRRLDARLARTDERVRAVRVDEHCRRQRRLLGFLIRHEHVRPLQARPQLSVTEVLEDPHADTVLLDERGRGREL